jgi:hypothetical protein
VRSGVRSFLGYLGSKWKNNIVEWRYGMEVFTVFARRTFWLRIQFGGDVVGHNF